MALNGSLAGNHQGARPTTTDRTPPGDDTMKLEDLEILKTIGTGTFARVCLCRIKNSSAQWGTFEFGANFVFILL